VLELSSLGSVWGRSEMSVPTAKCGKSDRADSAAALGGVKSSMTIKNRVDPAQQMIGRNVACSGSS
jgi:hypothetical protein